MLGWFLSRKHNCLFSWYPDWPQRTVIISYLRVKWQPDRAEESVIFYLINYEVSLSVITFHFGTKLFKYAQKRTWSELLTVSLSAEGSETKCPTAIASPPFMWRSFWTDWIIGTNSDSLLLSESLVYSYCSQGLSPPSPQWTKQCNTLWCFHAAPKT